MLGEILHRARCGYSTARDAPSAPGWTARGYPNLQGYAWYRLRLRIIGSGEPLWLKMPNDFDDGYQVYANGSYVGEFGRFSADHVIVYSARAVSFPLPKPGPDARWWLSATSPAKG